MIIDTEKAGVKDGNFGIFILYDGQVYGKQYSLDAIATQGDSDLTAYNIIEGVHAAVSGDKIYEEFKPISLQVDTLPENL